MSSAKVSATDLNTFSKLSQSKVLQAFRQVRETSRALCTPLKPEDCNIQSMPEVSPPKWHLAHTSWFFETFILRPTLTKAYRPFDPRFQYLFNSYYEGVGPYHPRSERGNLSRPTLNEVMDYRAYVDQAIEGLIIKKLAGDQVLSLLELGLHHEQQHQELMLMDIKHIFFCNPLRPSYQEWKPEAPISAVPLKWQNYPEGLFKIGWEGKGFAYDNECPRHRVFVEAFRLGTRLVTNGEYLEFIQDGAYQNPLLWLSDGWDQVLRSQWTAPLYWEKSGDAWVEMTLSGQRPLDLNEPVCHVSFYEAEAFARWAERRLPTEAEWEISALSQPIQGNFFESKRLHPEPAPRQDSGFPVQLFGDVWEWTASPYVPYPGFKPAAGPVGEYNGKFMCNQMVLRGGSCLSSESHIRPSYRNFFFPHQRWHCAGIRLAEDA